MLFSATRWWIILLRFLTKSSFWRKFRFFLQKKIDFNIIFLIFDHYYLNKIPIFWPKFRFFNSDKQHLIKKIRFYSKITFFWQNSDFFCQNSDFLPKFRFFFAEITIFFAKISIKKSKQNIDLWPISNFSIFKPKFHFFGKISIFHTSLFSRIFADLKSDKHGTEKNKNNIFLPKKKEIGKTGLFPQFFDGLYFWFIYISGFD